MMFQLVVVVLVATVVGGCASSPSPGPAVPTSTGTALRHPAPKSDTPATSDTMPTADCVSDPEELLARLIAEDLPVAERDQAEVVSLDDINGDGKNDWAATFSGVITASWIVASGSDGCYREVYPKRRGVVLGADMARTNGWANLTVSAGMNTILGATEQRHLKLRLEYNGDVYEYAQVIECRDGIGQTVDEVECAELAHQLFAEGTSTATPPTATPKSPPANTESDDTRCRRMCPGDPETVQMTRCYCQCIGQCQ